MIGSQSLSSSVLTKAYFYRRYRPPLPRALLNGVASRVQNDALLDLGCGPGRVTVPLAPFFREVIAVDPDTDMIDEARRHALEANVSNIHWHVGTAEEFDAPLGKFDLITIG